MDDRALDEALNEDIKSTLASINERNAEPDTPDDTPETKADRARDELGKFAKTESAAPAETPDNQPPSGAVEQVAVDTPEVTGQAPAVDLNRAPSSWKPAAKAAWASLPEPIRAEIHRREFDFHNSTFKGPLKENADFGQSIRTTLEPYRALIEAEGGTPERAIADTMRTAALFRTGTQQQKLEAIWSRPLHSLLSTGMSAWTASWQASKPKSVSAPKRRSVNPTLPSNPLSTRRTTRDSPFTPSWTT
jgi:hypothetical protein